MTGVTVTTIMNSDIVLTVFCTVSSIVDPLSMWHLSYMVSSSSSLVDVDMSHQL